jgi:hypothetical protein
LPSRSRTWPWPWPASPPRTTSRNGGRRPAPASARR